MRPAFFGVWQQDEDPLVILGGLAANTSFTAREIDSFTVEDARFWWNALAAYHQKVKEAQEG